MNSHIFKILIPLVLTLDEKRLAYLIAKLPLKTKEFEEHIKENSIS